LRSAAAQHRAVLVAEGKEGLVVNHPNQANAPSLPPASPGEGAE
jgi:hypothetical protein